jgi:hypothetical protein
MPHFRHGLLSRAVVISGESNDRFAALLAALRDELKPQTFLENSLVDTMAVARWRLFRLWGVESTTISEEMRKQEGDPGSSTLSPAVRAAVVMRSLTDKADFVNRMSRYETALDRQFARALKQFQELRKKSENYDFKLD